MTSSMGGDYSSQVSKALGQNYTNLSDPEKAVVDSIISHIDRMGKANIHDNNELKTKLNFLKAALGEGKRTEKLWVDSSSGEIKTGKHKLNRDCNQMVLTSHQKEILSKALGVKVGEVATLIDKNISKPTEKIAKAFENTKAFFAETSEQQTTAAPLAARASKGEVRSSRSLSTESNPITKSSSQTENKDSEGKSLRREVLENIKNAASKSKVDLPDDQTLKKTIKQVYKRAESAGEGLDAKSLMKATVKTLGLSKNKSTTQESPPQRSPETDSSRTEGLRPSSPRSVISTAADFKTEIQPPETSNKPSISSSQNVSADDINKTAESLKQKIKIQDLRKALESNTRDNEVYAHFDIRLMGKGTNQVYQRAAEGLLKGGIDISNMGSDDLSKEVKKVLFQSAMEDKAKADPKRADEMRWFASHYDEIQQGLGDFERSYQSSVDRYSLSNSENGKSYLQKQAAFDVLQKGYKTPFVSKLTDEEMKNELKKNGSGVKAFLKASYNSNDMRSAVESGDPQKISEQSSNLAEKRVRAFERKEIKSKTEEMKGFESTLNLVQVMDRKGYIHTRLEQNDTDAVLGEGKCVASSLNYITESDSALKKAGMSDSGERFIQGLYNSSYGEARAAFDAKPRSKVDIEDVVNLTLPPEIRKQLKISPELLFIQNSAGKIFKNLEKAGRFNSKEGDWMSLLGVPSHAMSMGVKTVDGEKKIIIRDPNLGEFKFPLTDQGKSHAERFLKQLGKKTYKTDKFDLFDILPRSKK